MAERDYTVRVTLTVEMTVRAASETRSCAGAGVPAEAQLAQRHDRRSYYPLLSQRMGV